MKSIKELTSKNIPVEIIHIWENAGYTQILPVQNNAVESGVLEGKSFLIVSPTSSGKTFIGEMTAVSHALRGRKTLYLVPFKALAEEKYVDFSEKYGEEGIGFMVRISDRDHRETDREISIGNYDIAILTYEKLSALLVLNPGILDSCDCIVIDEVQMIMDLERGSDLELLLTKLKLVPNLQIIALSAVLDDLNDFDEWLDLNLIQRNDRPVELRQGVILPDGTFHYREWNSGELGEEEFIDGTFEGLIQELLEKGEQIIIIRNSVRAVWQMAMGLENRFSDLPAASHTIKALHNEPDTETKNDLLITLRNSVAFHHADCELSERRIVEKGFRRGEIRLLVATTTLSMGVNLPCKTVVLADNFKWDYLRGGLQQVKWLVGEVRNIFGRAGRLGKSEDFGRGIFLASNKAEMFKLRGAYLDAPLEPVHSVFEFSDVSSWVLDIVSTGFAKNMDEIAQFFFRSFAARNWSDEREAAHIRMLINEAIQRNLKYQLFESTEDDIKITPLGKVCAAKGVSIESFNELKIYMESISGVDTLDMAFAAALSPEVRSVYYRGVKWFNRMRRQKVAGRLHDLHSDGELSGWIDERFSQIWQSFDEENAPQFTIALLARDILKTHRTMKELREGYELSTATIKNICLNLSWLLDTLSGIADVMFPQLAGEIEEIAECVNHCAPLSAKHLNTIDVYLFRDELIRLVKAGFKTEDDFIGMTAGDFKGIINPQKADKVIENILHKREKGHLYWEREHKRRLAAIQMNTDGIDALYNASGDALEQAICDLFEASEFDGEVVPISDKKPGEPDLLMYFSDGNKITVQITVLSGAAFIDSRTAGDVISQSARFHPDGYICLGRPDFQHLAREQANHLAKEYNFKLMPMYGLAELWVRSKEGKMTAEAISDSLWNARGYVSF